MKTKEEVLALFRAKYDHLKSVYPEVGSFDEAASTNFYQNPDGGWQLNLPPCAAITLRPGDDEAHEIHGELCARWYQEGGAFERDMPGWLGYPVEDQEATDFEVRPPPPLDFDFNNESWVPGPIKVNGTVAAFDFGIISWHSGLPWERANETNAYVFRAKVNPALAGDKELEALADEINAAFKNKEAVRPTDPKALCCPPGKDLPFAVPPQSVAELNEAGTTYVPPDIDAAIQSIIPTIKLCQLSEMTSVCSLVEGKGAVWSFLGATWKYGCIIICLWREKNNIRAVFDAKKTFLWRLLSVPMPKEESLHEEFTIPNNFKVMRRK